MSLQIRPIDPSCEQEMEAFVALRLAQIREADPDATAPTVDDEIATWNNLSAEFEERCWLAYDDDQLVGFVEDWGSPAGVPDDDKRGYLINVAWAHRRRGIGSALARFVEEHIPARCTTFTTELNLPLHKQGDVPGLAFMRRLGFAMGEVSTIRVLDWPADPVALNDLDPQPVGYEIASYTNGIPEHLRESYGKLVGMLAKDSPDGKIDWAYAPLSPEAYAAGIARDIALDRTRIETLAIRDGEVVAFTECTVVADARRRIRVGGTYVRRDHRGRKLGLAIKIEIERELLRRGVSSPKLCTGNADTNVWMIAINDQLGFKPAWKVVSGVKQRGEELPRVG